MYLVHSMYFLQKSIKIPVRVSLLNIWWIVFSASRIELHQVSNMPETPDFLWEFMTMKVVRYSIMSIAVFLAQIVL